ncbi:MAG TPA: hypothetical protein DCW44_02875 [Eubacterium sp.]|nr:hypothetical protein [Eubacterium sp.]
MKISLKQIKDYFKAESSWTDSISIGKIDNNQEKALCFYNSKRNLAYSPVIGGKNNKSTYIKPITILLRYTKNQDSAESKIQEIYEFFEGRTFLINQKRIFVMMNTEEPINLGTDEKGVYEYSIEMDLYIER